jgi:hypothetical protein
MSFKQLWGLNAIGNTLKEQKENVEADIIRAFSFIGEEFVNKARNKGEYVDRTGNLRASIGYAVFKDRKQVLLHVEETRDDTQRLLQYVTRDMPKGIVLVLFAGMEYAIYVEATNRDVITGSVPTNTEFRNEVAELLE